ncbi:MAG: phosphotriesterase [Spirochaetaceae bacterium]|nr:MAG: phosphotriesterase [Spirochaetaceae bacterium]
MEHAGKIMTVTGPVEPKDFGFTLPHEHILVDFIGAAEVGPHRYNADHVVETMQPYLEAARALGVTGFVECTPMYLARDAAILRTLAERTGMHILTNTGQYKPPYLPETTFSLSAHELAAQWIEEWNEGIDGTGIRPGFIKTAVEPGVLPDILRTTITAAALTSRETGLTIGTHCGNWLAAREILTILETQQVSASRWIFIHAQNESDSALLLDAASRGAWIELDGIGEGTDEAHLVPLLRLLDAGFEAQILLSQDAGWYRVGEEPGGEKKSYTYIIDRFLPLLGRYGLNQQLIDTLMIDNPARAFTIQP